MFYIPSCLSELKFETKGKTYNGKTTGITDSKNLKTAVS